MTGLTPERIEEIRARLAGWEECESHPSCHGCPHEIDEECPGQCGPEDVRDLLQALDSARREEGAMSHPSRVQLHEAVWVHPEAAQEALDALMPGPFGEVDPHWYDLRAAVSLVDHIARHPAGTEAIIAQVREYRRALRREP